MAIRRSKWQRRKIAKIIDAKRRDQPGYSELLNQEKTINNKWRTAETAVQNEFAIRRQAIILSKPLAAIAYRIYRTKYHIAEFAEWNPLASTFIAITVIIACLLNSAVAISTASFIGLYILAWWIHSRHLHKERHQLDALTQELIEAESRLYKLRRNEIASANQAFSGYPPDWGARREQVLRRDSNTCQTCGRRFTAKDLHRLHIHHIQELSRGGDNSLENLTALCMTCHAREHASSKA